MLIDKPTCSFTECRKNHDHNCFASEGYRQGCDFRVINKAFELVCGAFAEELDSSFPHQMRRFEDKAVKELTT